MINSGTSITTILIFTDFSEAATNATNYAVSLANQLHIKSLLICFSEHIPSTMEVHIQNIRLAEQAHHRYLEQLDDLKVELRSLLNEQIAIKAYIDQRPLDVIVDNFNKDRSAGLIVMGLAGKSALEQTLLGSNTIRVIKISTIPILIIPESVSFKPVENVVFACDLKNVSKNTPVIAIKRIVNKLGAKLSVLNVNRKKEYLNLDNIKELSYIRQLWDKEQPEYHTIYNEDIVKGIMDYASENHVHLVIAVPKKYGFFEKLFHDSLTRKLAYHIHLPLLLLKEENA
jgi:nucleotide-binding universal stress UspA family protein